jgi:hypothetical protein
VEAAGAFQQQFLDKFSKKSNPGPLIAARRELLGTRVREFALPFLA